MHFHHYVLVMKRAQGVLPIYKHNAWGHSPRPKFLRNAKTISMHVYCTNCSADGQFIQRNKLSNHLATGNNSAASYYWVIGSTPFRFVHDNYHITTCTTVWCCAEVQHTAHGYEARNTLINELTRFMCSLTSWEPGIIKKQTYDTHKLHKVVWY